METSQTHLLLLHPSKGCGGKCPKSFLVTQVNVMVERADMIHITGDTHGSLTRVQWYARDRLTSDDLILVCGDFGMLWSSMPTREEFPKLPCPVLFVDGNHENFDLLADLPRKKMFGGQVGVVQIDGEDVAYHLLRGCVYTIQGQRFFTLGGGVSIDRNRRIEGVSWWRREVPTTLEGQRALYHADQVGEVDYVVTHAAPLGALGLVRRECFAQSYPAYADAKIVEMGRSPVTRLLSEVDKRLDYKEWFFGHYHFDGNDGKYTGLFESWVQIWSK